MSAAAARSSLDVVIDALERHGCAPRRRGDELDARCPAHDDHMPSLSVRYDRGAGKVLLNCHTGCQGTDVIAALGLSWGDLFDTRTDEDSGRVLALRPKVVATYDYRDLNGQLLYQKLRYHPKDFRVRRPDGNGGWIWRIGDAPRVLYRLAEVRAAVAAGRPILLVEGEKDADRVACDLGMVATCNYEGAAKDEQRPKWRREYTEQLAGARVLIVADNDEAGLAHARAAAEQLAGTAESVGVFRPAVDWPKADMSDHLDTEHTVEDLVPLDPPASDGDELAQGRQVSFRAASGIRPRRARWLWDLRMPVGELTLLAGREGIGKSAITYTLVADITRGRLPGESHGTPRAVAIAATEDSWEHTIVPRLMAAGADLDLVFFIEVTAADGYETVLTLPRDLEGTEARLGEHGCVLLVLDPLLSRLDGRLDSHKDSEVRQALEPLVRVGQRAGCAILGLIHVNKANTKDPLNSIMASRAFTAVARAVLFAMADPDERGTTLLGLPKSNLGPTTLPTLTFTLAEVEVARDDDGAPITAVRLNWGPERADSIRDVLEQSGVDPEMRTVTAEAAAWLHDYLVAAGGTDRSADIIRKGQASGFGRDGLQRARTKLRLTVRSDGFPRCTWWSLPD